MARCNRCKCQNETVLGRKFCQYHLDLFKKNALNKTRKRRANNCCHECGKPKEQIDKRRCNKCLQLSKDKFRERFETNRTLGLCVICSTPKNNGRSSMCNKCADKDKLRIKARRVYCKENKLCCGCYIKIEGNKTLCLDCSIKNNIRKNIILALRKEQAPKSSRTEEIIGCKIGEFRDHIKRLMEPWMNANNYGIHVPGERRWNLGHALPTSSFDLSKPEELKKCFYYKNMFPQEAQENAELQDKLFLDGILIRGRDIRS
jgi:hypothetical protein